MDFPLDALEDIAAERFGSVAHLVAVTRDGVPVRCWTFPGNTTALARPADTAPSPGTYG